MQRGLRPLPEREPSVKRVSASGAETFVVCPASAVLPQHDAYSDAADAGTEGHTLIANVIDKKPGAADMLAQRYPNLGFKLAEKLQGVKDVRAETAYVVDVEKRTAVSVGHGIGRKYERALGRPMRDFEMGSSLDLEGSSGRPWIRDLKFGIYHSWWQLTVQAMALCWSRGLTEADVGFLFIDEDEDGNVEIHEESRVLYLLDLDNAADQLMGAFRRATQLHFDMSKDGPASLPTVEGKHCTYCGAYPHCPSKWKLAKAMMGELDISASVAAMAPEALGALWKKLGEFEKNQIKKTKDAIKERLRVEGPMPTTEGKAIKLITMAGRDSLDRSATLALLKAKGATREEVNALFKTGAEYTQVKEVNR
jgi:hypothetical protein